MCDLAKRVPDERAAEIAAKRKEAESIFEISQDSPSDPLAKKPTAEEMEWACRVFDCVSIAWWPTSICTA